MAKLDDSKRLILFFDGECHLCNGVVDSLIQKDKNRKLLFASLQGETAAQLLAKQDRESLDTVILFDSGKIAKRSTAVIEVVAALGGAYQLILLSYVVPRFVRDLIYQWIAKNRYTWFGKKEICRIPTPQEREYLLP